MTPGDPTIMCAVCRRPVARVVTIDQPGSMTRTFRAYCHGEVDECSVGLAGVRDLSDAIQRGEPVQAVAFAGRQALASTRRGEER